MFEETLWQRKLRCESSSELRLDGLTNGGGEGQFAVTRHANKGLDIEMCEKGGDL